MLCDLSIKKKYKREQKAREFWDRGWNRSMFHVILQIGVRVTKEGKERQRLEIEKDGTQSSNRWERTGRSRKQSRAPESGGEN